MQILPLRVVRPEAVDFNGINLEIKRTAGVDTNILISEAQEDIPGLDGIEEIDGFGSKQKTARLN